MLFPAPPAPQSLSALKERHHEIKRRLIAGDRQVDIAHALGMTQSRLSIVINSPAFQSELRILRAAADLEAADVGKRITKLAPAAMKVLEAAILQTPDGIGPLAKVGIAKDVLFMAGHSPAQRAPQGAGLFLTADDIEQIKARRARPILEGKPENGN
jgi:hypothetical protein